MVPLSLARENESKSLLTSLDPRWGTAEPDPSKQSQTQNNTSEDTHLNTQTGTTVTFLAEDKSVELIHLELRQSLNLYSAQKFIPALNKLFVSTSCSIVGGLISASIF